jgi:GT2 family glycosyltransferase
MRASVAAIVVSYGPSDRAWKCVLSLLLGDVVPEDILVVHNGPDPLGSPPPQITVNAHGSRRVLSVQAPENLGYSGGLRLGVETLGGLGIDATYLWMLNNDIVVHARALGALLAAAGGDPTIGLWGATVCSTLDFSFVSAVGVRYSRWTTRRDAVMSGIPVVDALAAVEPTFDFVPGSSMFVRRKVYDQCGGLGAAYFLYFEELDLAARIRRLGLEVGWCREALVAHESGATTKAYSGRRSRPPAVTFHSSRSAIIYTLRHDRLALPAVLFVRLVGHVCIHAAMGNFLHARAAFRGCVEGFRVERENRAAAT